MKIQPNDTDVGQFYVLVVNVRTNEANIQRYWKHYEDALRDAHESWYGNPNMGNMYLVLEVQGKVSAGAPQLTTKLTEKL